MAVFQAEDHGGS